MLNLNRSSICKLIATTLALGAAHIASAAEGGASHYVQGTQGDFAMALIGPPGLYIRDDVGYMEGSMGPVTRGNFVLQSYEQTVWVNTLKIIYLAPGEILNGRLGLVVGLPYAVDVNVNGRLASPVGHDRAFGAG
jgi:hypothetical protein